MLRRFLPTSTTPRSSTTWRRLFACHDTHCALVSAADLLRRHELTRLTSTAVYAVPGVVDVSRTPWTATSKSRWLESQTPTAIPVRTATVDLAVLFGELTYLHVVPRGPTSYSQNIVATRHHARVHPAHPIHYPTPPAFSPPTPKLRRFPTKTANASHRRMRTAVGLVVRSLCTTP